MTGLLADETMALAEQAARRVLAACAEGDLLRTQLAILRRLARFTPAEPYCCKGVHSTIPALIIRCGFAAAGSMFNGFDHRFVECRNVIGLAAGYELAIDDNLAIYPVGAGILQISLERRPGSDSLSPQCASSSVHGPWQIAPTVFPVETNWRTKFTALGSIRRWSDNTAGQNQAIVIVVFQRRIHSLLRPNPWCSIP
jgi:hypothetical protein